MIFTAISTLIFLGGYLVGIGMVTPTPSQQTVPGQSYQQHATSAQHQRFADAQPIQQTVDGSVASGLVAVLVRDPAQRATVTCRGHNGAFVCESSQKVTWTHPGVGVKVDYWSGFPAPTEASGCQVKVDGPTRAVTCQPPGATFVADRITAWAPN